jgi:4-amino-4-deoxy-L-arabinose transferase-like glycosyltransferase
MAPPFVYLYLRFGEAYIDGYVLDENLRLFASSRCRNQPGFWFYFRILAAGLLPWTGMSATSGRALWRTDTPLTRFVVVTEAR